MLWIFLEIFSFYDPLQAVLNNVELNCIFPSKLILYALIYCKKGRVKRKYILILIFQIFGWFPYKVRNLQEQSAIIKYPPGELFFQPRDFSFSDILVKKELY
jgi:hypothetical protein